MCRPRCEGLGVVVLQSACARLPSPLLSIDVQKPDERASATMLRARAQPTQTSQFPLPSTPHARQPSIVVRRQHRSAHPAACSLPPRVTTRRRALARADADAGYSFDEDTAGLTAHALASKVTCSRWMSGQTIGRAGHVACANSFHTPRQHTGVTRAKPRNHSDKRRGYSWRSCRRSGRPRPSGSKRLRSP